MSTESREINRNDELEFAASRYAPRDAVVAWSARVDEETERYQEAHLAFLSPSDRTLTIVRAWRTADAAPAVSVDATFGKDVLQDRIGREHAESEGFRQLDTDDPLDAAFRGGAKGDVLVLWDFRSGDDASYLARVANAYGEDRIVGGTVSLGVDGPYVETTLDLETEELFAEATPAPRR